MTKKSGTMEEAAKSIESIAKHILPTRPHCLSIHPDRRYRPHPDDKRLEEQVFRPLQYQTFVSDADRGVTLTRAYFDIREEPVNPHNARSNTPATRTDPTKPVTKLSLKDYKNRGKQSEGDSPTKPRPPQPNNGVAPKPKPPPPPPPPKNVPEIVAKDMDSPGDFKKGTTKPRSEAIRRRSPSPEVKKRVPPREDDARPAKRIKADDPPPNATGTRPSKPEPPSKLERKISHEKKSSKETKPLSGVMTNGRTALNTSSQRSSSPKPAVRVNGSQKTTTTTNTPKKTEGSSQSSSVPPLLSPLRIDGLDPKSEDLKTIRASPKKKPPEISNAKPAKKSRDDREPSPSPKKRKLPLKVPPLLSPTLPPIVMEELERMKKTAPAKDNQKSSQMEESPQPSAQKTVKASKRDETIYVENKKDEAESFVVTLKYKKRNAKRVERLLALQPRIKRQADGLKKEELSMRERTDSLEPSTSRKRPRTAADAHPAEATKRPRTSENLQPSTPLPKQSASMTRVASSSSLAGTPGTSNDLTPGAPPHSESRRAPVDVEQVRRLMSRANAFRELGTKLKHERDAIMRGARGPASERDHYIGMAAGTQCLLAYMLSFKIETDARDLEQRARVCTTWKELMPLLRVIKNDCGKNNQISALIVRMQGICLVYMGRALWSYPNQPEAAKDLLQNSKEQHDVWRQAEKARKGLGVYDGSSSSNDGGVVGKLIDRLGPWSSPEDATPVAIEILRRSMRYNEHWKPAGDLARLGHSLTNGSSH